MTESNSQIFLTSLPDEKRVQSIIINDDEDDIDIDVKSSADSEDTPMGNNEIEKALNRKESQEFSCIIIPNTTNDTLQDKMSHDDPSPSAAGDHLQTIISGSLYDYAAMVHETLESPRQNKLDHDVYAVLGSNDPPPGFGFLHPRFYYLEQKRPVPMEPLRVWRGFNGHVYFSPIQVQHLETDRIISPTKPRKSTAIRSVSLSAKPPNRSRTILSAYRNNKTVPNKDRINNERVFANRQAYARTISNEKDLKNNTLATFIEGEANKEETTKMWRSVVTCIPVQIKPISKRSQHTIEDLEILQQEQFTQDPTNYNRQVLPNIRPVPKSKFVYKGLAYKEVKKVPGMNIENDDNDDTGFLKKPLIDYNLTQAYIRYEINAARTKQNVRQSSISTVKDQPLTKTQTALDLREIRKRIVTGTTLAYRPTLPPASRIQGRADNKSTIGSEVSLPVRGLSTLIYAPTVSPLTLTSPLQQLPTIHTTPVLSQLFDISSTDNMTNVSSLQNPYARPTTSKSSIPSKQTTVLEMPILTKYVSRPRSISRQTPTSEICVNAS